MRLFDVLKKKHVKELESNQLHARSRRQLNMVVDNRLADALTTLRKQFTVNRDVVGEHALEVGCFYLGKTVQNQEKMAQLRRHLVDSHLIDDGSDDSEAILRLGEGGDMSGLLALADKLLVRWSAFQRAVSTAEKTQSLDQVNKCEKDLVRGSIALAAWLDSHGLFDDSGGDKES